MLSLQRVETLRRLSFFPSALNTFLNCAYLIFACVSFVIFEMALRVTFDVKLRGVAIGTVATFVDRVNHFFIQRGKPLVAPSPNYRRLALNTVFNFDHAAPPIATTLLAGCSSMPT